MFLTLADRFGENGRAGSGARAAGHVLWEARIRCGIWIRSWLAKRRRSPVILLGRTDDGFALQTASDWRK